MGLIKALAGATSTTFGDQWLEYFYCDSMAADVLCVKGQKRVNSKKSSNKHGSDNIISNGSIIAVNEGQAMMIVDQGEIVEFAAEAGEYKFDTSTEGSVFSGSLGQAIFKAIGRRFKFGGDTGKDQRVYFFNLKELVDNKFGTAQPVPFRAVDSKIGLDIDISVRCNGVFSYRIANPVLFYKNVCGNVTDSFKRSNLDTQLKTEFISALQPAFGKLSQLEMRPNQLPAHVAELEKAMNEALSEKWSELRGIEIVNIALGSVTIPKDDEELIKNLQRQAVYRDPSMAAASLVGAQGDAMRTAAGNANGAAMGFFGMNMAAGAGGFNANQLYGMAQQNQAQQAQQAPQQASANSWKCSCGNTVTGKFCPECGAKKPEVNGWTCSCGTVNKGKFCIECGAKKPEGALLYKCDKCGWEPKDPKNPPRFCPECGDPFDSNDAK